MNSPKIPNMKLRPLTEAELKNLRNCYVSGSLRVRPRQSSAWFAADSRLWESKLFTDGSILTDGVSFWEVGTLVPFQFHNDKSMPAIKQTPSGLHLGGPVRDHLRQSKVNAGYHKLLRKVLKF